MQKTWHAYKKPYFFLLTSKNLSTSDIPCSEVIKKKKKKISRNGRLFPGCFLDKERITDKTI